MITVPRAATRSTSSAPARTTAGPTCRTDVSTTRANSDGRKNVRVGDGATSRPDVEEPIYYWVPSIAPSGMMFYTGDMFPEWKGNLFIGAMAGQHLVRLVLNGERVVAEEQLLADREAARPRSPAGARRLDLHPAGRVDRATDAQEVGSSQWAVHCEP